MKKVLLIGLLIFACERIYAQQVDTTYYYDSETYDEINFSFGLPSAEVSNMMGKTVFSLGANASFYHKMHLFYGFYGQRLGTEIYSSLQHDTVFYDKLRLGYGHIGLEGGYIFYPEKKLNYILGMRHGWGSVSFSDDRSHVNSNGSKIEYTKKIETHQIYVFSPFAQVNYAVSPNLKIGFQIGYRKNFGFQNLNYSDKDFDSFYASLSILFGNYSYPKFE